jgi:perosamine synthetase
LLSDLEEIELPEVPADIEHAWHLFIIRLRLERLRINRDEFIEELGKAGTGTSVHFIPLHLQSYYMRAFGCRRGDYPNAERTYERSISLPLYSGLQLAGVDRVGNTLRRIIEENKKTLINHATRI